MIVLSPRQYSTDGGGLMERAIKRLSLKLAECAPQGVRVTPWEITVPNGGREDGPHPIEYDAPMVVAEVHSLFLRECDDLIVPRLGATHSPAFGLTLVLIQHFLPPIADRP